MDATVERRTRKDPRQLDSGPPSGCFDRRRRAERRLPTAEESLISDTDWDRYFGTTAGASNSSDVMLDHAAEVLDRVRDRY